MSFWWRRCQSPLSGGSVVPSSRLVGHFALLLTVSPFYLCLMFAFILTAKLLSVKPFLFVGVALVSVCWNTSHGVLKLKRGVEEQCK